MSERRRDTPPQAERRSDPEVDRPTIHPPFDVEKFARQSDMKLRVAEKATSMTTAPPPDDAPVVDALEEMSDADAEEVYRAQLGGDDQVVVRTGRAGDRPASSRRPEEQAVLALVDGKRTVAEVVQAS